MPLKVQISFFRKALKGCSWQMVDRAYDAARQRLVKRLEEELKKNFDLEVQRTVKERHDQAV